MRHNLRTGLDDTSAKAAAMLREIYKEMSTARKIELVEDANTTARKLALSGLAMRFPGANEKELHLRLFHLILPKHLALEVYGPLPEERDE